MSFPEQDAQKRRMTIKLHGGMCRASQPSGRYVVSDYFSLRCAKKMHTPAFLKCIHFYTTTDCYM